MTVLDTKQLNKLWAKSADLRSPQRDRHLYDLAFFLWSNKKFEEAVAVADSALDEIGDRIGTNLWIDVKHLQSLALHDSKRDEEAIAAELEALTYAETLQSANERGFMHLHLADCYRTTDQPELQEKEYLTSLEAFKNGDNKFILSQVLLDLANLCYRSKKYVDSKNYLLQLVPILEEMQATDRIPFIKYRLSGIERNLGNPRAALSYAQEAVELSKFIDDTVATRENKIELALVHEALGNFEAAIEVFDTLIEDNNEQLKNRSAAKAIYYRARVLETMGDNQAAISGYSSCISILKAVNLDDLAINSHLSVLHLNIQKMETHD